jgi:hypothetical protein
MWTLVVEFLIKTLLTPKNIAFARQAIVTWLLKEVPNTENKIDDQVVKAVADALGVTVIGGDLKK